VSYQSDIDMIKSVVFTMSTKSISAFIKAQIPFFNLPIISNILDMVIKQIMGIAIDKTELGAFFLYINFHVNAQGKDFLDAARKNAIIQQSGTPEEKANAEKNLINSARAFIKFTT
jgi:hypothetical protein